MRFVVTGIGSVVLPKGQTEAQVGAWLKNRKMRKFMGKQDLLAVAASSQAAQAAGLTPELLKDASLHLSVGYIPFEFADVEPIASGSTADGAFSMARFSTDGYTQANPLLTFRCLPNMPIFHVSLNLGIQGRYFVTYPGPGQFWIALQAAARALEAGDCRVALVGGTADQENFLVSHHFGRDPRTSDWVLADASGFLCLETEEGARERGASALWRLEDLEVGYAPFDPARPPAYRETGAGAAYLGPAALPVHLSRMTEEGSETFAYELRSLDGVTARAAFQRVETAVPA